MNFGTEARREREKFELQNTSVTVSFKHYFNRTNELTLIQLPLKKISNCLCSRIAIGILYCSRSFRVGRRLSLRECKTRRRYLNGTTSSFENPGHESKVVYRLLVWLYIRLWICPVLTKNWRQKSVLYPSLQNVVADIRGNNDVNLAGFTLEQYKKPTSFVEAIEVAFYTTNCYPSSSFHNKIPFMIYNSVMDPTYQFWNIQFVQLSDLWRFLPQMWTLSPPKIFFFWKRCHS